MTREYLGRADPFFTWADMERGYPETRLHLAGYADEQLIKEYLEVTKDGFNRMFGHNARAFSNLIVDELLARGITEIPNIFGAISVRRTERCR